MKQVIAISTRAFRISLVEVKVLFLIFSKRDCKLECRDIRRCYQKVETGKKIFLKNSRAFFIELRDECLFITIKVV